MKAMGPKNFIFQPKYKPPLSRIRLFYKQALATLLFYHKTAQVVTLDLDEFTMKSHNAFWGVRDMVAKQGGNKVLKRRG